MQLQKDYAKIHKSGIDLVGVSYDKGAVLSEFSKKNKLRFTLVSDTKSEAINAFGVLNKKARGFQKGVPHPVTIVVGKDGKIRAKLPGTVRDRHSVADLIKAAQSLGDSKD